MKCFTTKFTKFSKLLIIEEEVKNGRVYTFNSNEKWILACYKKYLGEPIYLLKWWEGCLKSYNNQKTK
jgi:hypothetical protein